VFFGLLCLSSSIHLSLLHLGKPRPLGLRLADPTARRAWSEIFGLPAIASSGEAGGLCLEIQSGSIGMKTEDYHVSLFCF